MPQVEEKYRCTICQSIVLASELESHEAFCPPKEEEEDEGYFSDEPSAASAGPQEPNPTLKAQEEAPSTTAQSKVSSSTLLTVQLPGKGIWTQARPDFGVRPTSLTIFVSTATFIDSSHQTSTRDYILRVEANRRRLKAEMDSEELRECTFTPRLLNRKTVTPRSHGSSHSAGRQQRLAIVGEEMHKECSHRPKICRRSAELARSRNPEHRAVYERLYETDRPLSSRHCGSEPNPELVPHPGGSRRGCRRSTTLYSEAAQRQSRRSEAASDLEAIVAQQASQGTKLSRGSQRAYRALLRRRLRAALTSTLGDADSMSLSDFARFLVVLGVEDAEKGRPLARRLWELVRLPDTDASTCSKCIHTMLHLLGGYSDEPPRNSGRASETVAANRNFEAFRKELRELLPSGQHRSTLLNRSSASSTDQTGGAADPDGVGSPSILGSSKRMAESSNEGLRQAYGVVDHADLLMLRKRLARDRLLVRAEEVADSELRDCTFKPKLVTRRRLRSNDRSDESTSSPACGDSRLTDSVRSYKRFEELYADGRTRDERLLGRAEAAIVAEREREAADCTFKPNIAASRISGEKVLQKKRRSGQQPLGYEAATTRLREATKKRQNLKQWRDAVRSQDYKPPSISSGQKADRPNREVPARKYPRSSRVAEV
ncbi:hypothetical protein FOL46_005608 [Perkinsus olseni]|uniref:Uncharacterized protein n=1 Tax=Perkinsus olseni TaxID=32597 RepID=A0A7J6LRD1_PEROL|nr:hypothetical protein FOL46_005608 [Perkinsus olseni]